MYQFFGPILYVQEQLFDIQLTLKFCKPPKKTTEEIEEEIRQVTLFLDSKNKIFTLRFYEKMKERDADFEPEVNTVFFFLET